MAAQQIDSPIYPTALMNMSSNYGREKKNKYVMSMKLERVERGKGKINKFNAVGDPFFSFKSK